MLTCNLQPHMRAVFRNGYCTNKKHLTLSSMIISSCGSSFTMMPPKDAKGRENRCASCQGNCQSKGANARPYHQCAVSKVCSSIQAPMDLQHPLTHKAGSRKLWCISTLLHAHPRDTCLCCSSCPTGSDTISARALIRSREGAGAG
jgi:hypothetical protein